MKWGRDHEDEARQFYIDTMVYKNTPEKEKVMVDFAPSPSYVPDEYKDVDIVPVDPNEVSDLPYSIRVDVCGLVVSTVKSYCAYSSDGEVLETDDKGLLEIKCPRRLYGKCRPQYFAQIQYSMWLKLADFLVWTPQGSTLARYAYNETVLQGTDTAHEDWYEREFLPEAIVAIEKQRAWKEARG